MPDSMSYSRFYWASEPNPFDRSLLPMMQEETCGMDVYKEGRFVGRITSQRKREKVEEAVKELLGSLLGNISVY